MAAEEFAFDQQSNVKTETTSNELTTFKSLVIC